ncbi:hypothetical protein FRC19_010027 [Serendipita sp. 401]|nr:hypothetical protein FRC19_010027 [Serendipita sp. 401]
MPGSVSVCLPNIPAPAHLPPPLRTNVAPHQGSLNATSGVLPLAGQTSRSSFISRANVASWVDSRDRTPTQSLYVSSTSLDASNKDRTKSIGERPPVAISMGSLDPGNSSSQSMERSVVPSLRSIRSIPSLPDISSQLFEEPEATFDGSTLLTDALVDISEISEVDLVEGVVKDAKIIESNGSPVVIKMHDDNFIPTP